MGGLRGSGNAQQVDGSSGGVPIITTGYPRTLDRNSIVRIIVWVCLLSLLFHCAEMRVYMYRVSNRVVNTQYGKLRGGLVQFPDRPTLQEVEAYLGLKYASLLGSGLRFMPPTSPSDYWDGARKVVKFGPACPQLVPGEKDLYKIYPSVVVDRLKRHLPFLIQQSEDCLNLNLYRPAVALTGFGTIDLQQIEKRRRRVKDRPKKPFATLVFIHGETYYSGSGNAYDGSVLSSYGDVIVVTLNYRLGVLGFFSSADSVATGNYALLDIIAALHWLRENLRAFDGDPARITLMGHGHGAALVDMLLVSPMSSGGLLFKNVILQSGSSLSTWATVTDPGACMHELAERAGCKKAGYNSSVIVSCLKQAPLSTLLKAIPSSAKYLTCVGPIVSSWSGVLPKSPALLHSEPVSSYLDTTVLVGVVKHEAIEFLTDKDIQNGITSERRKQILRTFVHNSYTFQRQRIYEILDYHYTDWESSIERRSLVSSTLEYLSDGLYVTPLIEVVNLRQRANTNTYVYTFSFSQMEGVLPSWMGSIHGDELAYVFGAPVVGVLSPFRSHFARTDRITSEAIMTYWSNFAQTSNPNLPINLQTRKTDQHKRLPDVSWPKFDTSSQAYLHIGKRLKISYHYKGRKIALWLELIPKLHKSEGVPSEDNMLDFSYNLTTFDEPEKLVDFHYLLSLTPPPTTTLVPNITRNPLTNNHMDSGNRKTPINESVLGNRRKNSRNSENRRTNSERTQPKNNTLVHPLLQTRTSKVSLSITIAIGCSLLFLNILAFMGVYYQRKKAVEMFSTQKNESITMNDSDKCQATGRMGFETTSLLEPAEGLCVRLNDSLEKNGHKETRTHNFKEDMCTCDDGDYTHQQQYKHLPNNTSTNYTYRQRENHPMQATSSFSKPTRLTVKINDVPVR